MEGVSIPNIRATVVPIEATVAATKFATVDEPGGYPEKGARRHQL